MFEIGLGLELSLNHPPLKGGEIERPVLSRIPLPPGERDRVMLIYGY